MMCMLLAGLAAVQPVLPAYAGEASAPTSVALTVYNDNLALIRETREFELAGGQQELVLSDVSGMLLPETVHLRFTDGAPFSLLEQNYSYDLFSLDRLLERYIGREVVLVDDITGARQLVTLLCTTAASGPSGPYQLSRFDYSPGQSTAGRSPSNTGSGYTVQTTDGSIMLNPPGRFELPSDAAQWLLLRPTLSWQLSSPAQGRHIGEISYLSGGLTWDAQYVVKLHADDEHCDIDGWVTLNNMSGTGYRDAELKLVAGHVNRVQKEEFEEKNVYLDRAYIKFTSSNAGFTEESFFEYHLYDLQRPTTINNNQQKQIELLRAVNVPYQKSYELNGLRGGAVQVIGEFTNDEASGMGMPLPAGAVRLYQADSSAQLQYAGEDRIDHTPKDEKIRLRIGNASDVTGRVFRTDYSSTSGGFMAKYRVVLANHKADAAVIVTVVIDAYYDILDIFESSQDFIEKSARRKEFSIAVPANGKVELTYSVVAQS